VYSTKCLETEENILGTRELVIDAETEFGRPRRHWSCFNIIEPQAMRKKRNKEKRLSDGTDELALHVPKIGKFRFSRSSQFMTKDSFAQTFPVKFKTARFRSTSKREPSIRSI